MPANGTNKTNIAALKIAIDLVEQNAAGATGNAAREIVMLCQKLRREIAWFEQGIQGLA